MALGSWGLRQIAWIDFNVYADYPNRSNRHNKSLQGQRQEK